jgi:hypothetical protein
MATDRFISGFFPNLFRRAPFFLSFRRTSTFKRHMETTVSQKAGLVVCKSPRLGAGEVFCGCAFPCANPSMPRPEQMLFLASSPAGARPMAELAHTTR